jgi:ribosomal protein S27AE
MRVRHEKKVASPVNSSLTIIGHGTLTIYFSSAMISAISQRRCPQCGSCIAAIGHEDVVECGICDFAHAAITLSDAIIAGSIRLSESADRVEVVLNHF